MNKREALKTIAEALTECEMKCDGPHIVVLDRGWIFQGNLSQAENGEYTLTSCVNVRSWEIGGFGGLSKGAKNAKATLDACAPIRFDKRSLIFSVPTDDDWGEK